MNCNTVYNKGLMYHHYANTAYPLTPLSFKEYRIGNTAEITEFVNDEWKKTDKLSLYVHIPFCQVRCKFCEYAVLENTNQDSEEEYVSLLLKEMAMYEAILQDKIIVGYDLGGGTPTKLSVENLKRITNAIVNSFTFDENVIYSIETTPVIAAKEPEKMKAIYDMGYRRISMGIQTISEKLLNNLGREGTTHIYEEASKNIRKAGFDKFNVDIMYGFLHQTDEELESTLRYAISLNPDYITLYRNRYKGTKIEEEAEGVSLYKIMKQYRLAYKLLTKNGYLANVGKNTFSKIEADYGTSDYLTKRVIEGISYVGMGLGAQSFGIDYLAYNEGAANKQLERYREKIKSGLLPIQDIYKLPKDESIAKMVSVAFYFGFVDLEAFQDRFGISFVDYFKEEVDYVLKNDLMKIESGRIILTERGADYINGVIPLFYSERSKLELISLFSKTKSKLNGEEAFLSAYDSSYFEKPSIATDMAIFTINSHEAENNRRAPDKHLAVLMIRRGEHPFMNCWALPGGFLKPGETVETAAYRELEEETGVTDVCLTQLHTFSEKDRDPRGWIISSSFIALGDSQTFSLHSGEDAIDAQWFSISYKKENVNVEKIQETYIKKEVYGLSLQHEEINLSAKIEVVTKVDPKRVSTTYNISETGNIAFDHAKILAYAITKLRNDLDTSMLAFELLPEYFTLSDLQKVYETILDKTLLTANFRRKIMDRVQETSKTTMGAQHRPAKLYKRNFQEISTIIND